MVDIAYQFDIEVKPKSLVVKPGDTIEVHCTADNYYDYCSIVHDINTCDFKYNDTAWRLSKQYPVIKINCQDYESRMEFIGDYYNYGCGIRLHSITMQDGGTWICQMEQWRHQNQIRYSGATIDDQFYLTVLPPHHTASAASSGEKSIPEVGNVGEPMQIGSPEEEESGSSKSNCTY